MRNALKGILLLCLAGCGGGEDTGDGLAREAVSGTVTLDGQPLSGAVIQFLPSDPSAAGGASGDIEGGKFAIESGQGPIAGTYRVVISTRMGPDVDASQPPGEIPKPKKDPIPAKYNTKSTLTADVKAGVPNTFDFPLTTK
jgi:hypothetical protein